MNKRRNLGIGLLALSTLGFSSLAVAERMLVGDTGKLVGGYVLCSDYSDYEEAGRAIRRSDDMKYLRLLSEGKCFNTATRANVEVLRVRNSARQVRLSGTMTGVAWTDQAFILPE